jgi:type VII secretion protein EccB
MPLNLASKAQASAFWFLRRRLAHALLRRSPSMDVEWERAQKLAVLLSVVVGVVGLGGAFLAGWWRPAGLVGNTAIVADKASGAIYVNVGGRLHPALNLVSAQLVTGRPDAPAFVSSSDIANQPKGPTVGIVGAPVATPAVLSPQVSRWAVCDTAPSTLAGAPQVTGIDGSLTLGAGSRALEGGAGALMSYGGQTFVVTSGVRMAVNISDRAVTQPLGIEVGHPVVAMSRALFDAVPAGGQLVVPTVPDAGAPAAVDVGFSVVNGVVVVTRDVSTGADQFYVVVGDVVQPVSPVVAGMLRQRDTFGFAAPPRVAPDRIAKIPTRHVLEVDSYPKSPLQLVDSADMSVTCAGWERGVDERQGRLSLIAARRLPVADHGGAAVIPLVGGGNGGVQADQVVFDDGAATFVTTTGTAPDSPERQTLWLFDATGVRYGIPFEGGAMQALGLSKDQARLAPWTMLQVWPAGPELSRAAALTLHGSSSSAPGAISVPAGAAEGR